MMVLLYYSGERKIKLRWANKMFGAIIGNALGLGLKIMDKMDRNSDKPSFEEYKERKKEMDKSLADEDVNGIDSMFEYLAERARAGKTGRKG